MHRSYTAQQGDEISVDKGKIVEVLEQTLDGWWLIRLGNKKGRFPSTNLAKADTLRAKDLSGRAAEPSGAQVIGSVKDVTGLSKQGTPVAGLSTNDEMRLRPDWEHVVKKASPLPEIKKRPAPRNTPVSTFRNIIF